MNLILPVSIYSDLIFGMTSAWKRAQCGHVNDAYSIIVTAASGFPKTISSTWPSVVPWANDIEPTDVAAREYEINCLRCIVLPLLIVFLFDVFTQLGKRIFQVLVGNIFNGCVNLLNCLR